MAIIDPFFDAFQLKGKHRRTYQLANWFINQPNNMHSMISIGRAICCFAVSGEQSAGRCWVWGWLFDADLGSPTQPNVCTCVRVSVFSTLSVFGIIEVIKIAHSMSYTFTQTLKPTMVVVTEHHNINSIQTCFAHFIEHKVLQSILCIQTSFRYSLLTILSICIHSCGYTSGDGLPRRYK